MNKLSETVSHILTVAQRAGYGSIAVVLADPTTRIHPDMTLETWHDVPWAALYHVEGPTECECCGYEPRREVPYDMADMMDQFDPFQTESQPWNTVRMEVQS